MLNRIKRYLWYVFCFMYNLFFSFVVGKTIFYISDYADWVIKDIGQQIGKNIVKIKDTKINAFVISYHTHGIFRGNQNIIHYGYIGKFR